MFVFTGRKPVCASYSDGHIERNNQSNEAKKMYVEKQQINKTNIIFDSNKLIHLVASARAREKLIHSLPASQLI